MYVAFVVDVDIVPSLSVGFKVRNGLFDKSEFLNEIVAPGAINA